MSRAPRPYGAHATVLGAPDEAIVRTLLRAFDRPVRLGVLAGELPQALRERPLKWLSYRLGELHELGWLQRSGLGGTRGPGVRWHVSEEAVAELQDARPGRLPRRLARLGRGPAPASPRPAPQPTSAQAGRLALPRTRPFDWDSGWRGVRMGTLRPGAEDFLAVPSLGLAREGRRA